MNWNVVIQEVVVVPHNTAPSLSFSCKVKGHRDIHVTLHFPVLAWVYKLTSLPSCLAKTKQQNELNFIYVASFIQVSTTDKLQVEHKIRAWINGDYIAHKYKLNADVNQLEKSI